MPTTNTPAPEADLDLAAFQRRLYLLDTYNAAYEAWKVAVESRNADELTAAAAVLHGVEQARIALGRYTPQPENGEETWPELAKHRTDRWAREDAEVAR